jgi:drug/metabolite transporter (DMT)-like permease
VSFLTLDLALATTLTFTTQLFVVGLAGPILGERVGLRRAGLALLGFLGVIVVTRVWDASFDPSVIYGLASALCGAGIVLISRALTRTETTDSILFYIGAVTSLGAGVALLANPQPIAFPDLGLVALAGALGVLGMAIMIEAFRIAEVSALAPAPYLRLVFAIIFGFALFGEMPTWSTLFGGGIIVLTALAASRSP